MRLVGSEGVFVTVVPTIENDGYKLKAVCWWHQGQFECPGFTICLLREALLGAFEARFLVIMRSGWIGKSVKETKQGSYPRISLNDFDWELRNDTRSSPWQCLVIILWSLAMATTPEGGSSIRLFVLGKVCVLCR